MIQSLDELTQPRWGDLDKQVQLEFYAECILDTNYPDGTFYFVNKKRGLRAIGTEACDRADIYIKPDTRLEPYIMQEEEKDA